MLNDDRAGELTAPMRVALERLGRCMVYIDGRSRRALVRRGLAQEFGSINDEMLGSFVCVAITDEGRRILEGQDHVS